jgi:hypothetical protein
MEDNKRKMKKHPPCYCDDCLRAHYVFPCTGCGGHSSFWKTVIESPQWAKWKKYAQPKMLYDFDECEELGILSPGHFNTFIKFLKRK